MINGVGNFTLKHEQTIIISEIPYGCWVLVEEVNVPDKYSATLVDSMKNGSSEGMFKTDDNGNINWSTGYLREISKDRAFQITNATSTVIPTNIDIGDVGALLPIMALALIFSLGFVISSSFNKRRKYNQ